MHIKDNSNTELPEHHNSGVVMNKLLNAVACGLACVGIISAVPITASAAPKVIKVTTHSSMAAALCRSLVEMKQFIEEKTDGRYRMDIYDQFKLGTMEEAYQGMGFGTVQMLVEGPSNIGTFMPELSMFDLGFLFPNSEVADKVLSGPVGQKICAATANKAVTPLAFVRYSFRNPFIKGDINSLDDLNSLKIRASSSPMHMAMLKSMGMNPVPMPGSEVFTGLQQGVVDGFDVDFPFGFTSKWYEAATSVAKIDHTYCPQILYVSTKWWNGLPAEDKPIFEEAVQVFVKAQERNQLEDEAQAEEAFKKAGIKIYVPTEEELTRMKQQSADLYKQFPKINVELLNELKAEVARVSSAQ